MATTSYTDFTAGCRAIGARTDAAGAAATDLASDEDRLINHVLAEGYLTAGAFEVAADSPASMDVIVGSGTAKADLYVVEGDDDGQHPYIVRLDDATKTVTLDAADASNPRIDEIWLVVADATFDSGGVSLPRLGYRKGTAAASPAAPGADSSWKAAVKLATITVGASASAIGSGDITDDRGRSSLTAVLLDSIIADPALREVDGSSEVASTSTSSSYADKATVSLSIPADWGSWSCFAIATFAFGTANVESLTTRIVIDGTAQQEQTSLGAYSLDSNGNRSGTVGGHRTGMTTTGSRTVAFQAKDGGTSVSVYDIFLYARAVRTS